jgi:hypothetical protein
MKTKLMTKGNYKQFTQKLNWLDKNNLTGLYNFVRHSISNQAWMKCADMVISELNAWNKPNTIKEFAKFDFEHLLSKQKTTLLKNRVVSIIALQTELNLYNKTTKEMAKATKPTAKKKVVAKKVKPVAKKKAVTKRETIKDKLTKQYKVVSNYSESLLQDVYSVVYRTKALKRFVNENLAHKYIEQEVILKMNEKAVASPEKIKGIKKELEAEFA